MRVLPYRRVAMKRIDQRVRRPVRARVEDEEWLTSRSRSCQGIAAPPCGDGGGPSLYAEAFRVRVEDEDLSKSGARPCDGGGVSPCGDVEKKM